MFRRLQSRVQIPKTSNLNVPNRTLLYKSAHQSRFEGHTAVSRQNTVWRQKVGYQDRALVWSRITFSDISKFTNCRCARSTERCFSFPERVSVCKTDRLWQTCGLHKIVLIWTIPVLHPYVCFTTLGETPKVPATLQNNGHFDDLSFRKIAINTY